MAFLKNTWYAAAFRDEFAETAILSRTLLDESVCIFVADDGTIGALEDKCPHRFAPLSLGEKAGGGIQCPYHGLIFDASGRCVSNPHGPITKSCRVKAYPAFERDEIVWIWMGDPELADRSKIPDLHFITQTKATAKTHGHIHSNCNYLLILDNLMDLTHVDYLHPGLGNGAQTARKPLVTPTPSGGISARYWMPGVKAPKTVAQYLDTGSDEVDQLTEMVWHPPGTCCNTSIVVAPPGGDIAAGAATRAAHLVTPETANTSHYFWYSTRNYAIDSVEANQRRKKLLEAAFIDEDKPMLEAVQNRMASSDLLRLNPLLLPIDSAVIKIRRELDRLIDAEAADAAAAERSTP